MTNGDRIRQMSNEELAIYIDNKIGYACRVCFYKANKYDKRGLCGGMCKEGIKAYLDMEIQE